MNGDIGVEEEDQWALPPGRPRFARRPGPAVSGSRNKGCPRFAGAGGRVVGRPVVNHDQLVIRQDEPRSRWRHAEVAAPVRTGTTTESDGLRSTGLAGPAGTSSMIYPRPSKLDTRRNASPSVGSPERVPRPTATERGDIDRRGVFEMSRPAAPPHPPSRRAAELYPEPPELSIWAGHAGRGVGEPPFAGHRVAQVQRPSGIPAPFQIATSGDGEGWHAAACGDCQGLSGPARAIRFARPPAGPAPRGR